MKNIAKFNHLDIQSIFENADIIGLTKEWESIGVTTDSRNAEAKNIFVALSGIQLDGHNYIINAIEKGASAVVVSREWFAKNAEQISQYSKIVFIQVTDTLVALGELATFHRRRFNFHIIAVAGSNGKTTTKELIYSVLSQKYKTIKTYKNFNNRIGVPLMMLQFSSEYEAAVIEIGTNKIGEIAILADMLQPTCGIITNIGKEHLEFFNNLDTVEMEELMLFGYLLKKGGKCYINIDDERLEHYDKVVADSITYGIDKESDFSASMEFDGDLYPTITFSMPNNDGTKYNAKLNAIGLGTAKNSVAAAAVGYGLGLSGESIVKGLEAYIAEADGYGRMCIEHINSLTILNDCYNANPSSMELSLDTLSMIKNVKYKIAALGDMYELGETALDEHINIINKALTIADKVIVVGYYMQQAANTILLNKINENLKVFDNREEIGKYFRNYAYVSPHKIAVLFKASRGVKMEEIIKLIKV
jgi:UDP-N-acetylmuramoyl-tripeptide--D-alanyl-D-alanine ligase